VASGECRKVPERIALRFPVGRRIEQPNRRYRRNRLQSAVNVINNQTQNLPAAEDQITAANIPEQVAKLSQYTILNQSGISALAQANSAQSSILNLLR
jgi:flagellin-like hook-associated protein FlgL